MSRPSGGTAGPEVVVCGRGVPGPAAPLLGAFELEQARALHEAGVSVVYAGLDVRSLRRWRRWGIVRDEIDGVPVMVLNAPLGRLPRQLNRVLMARLWEVLLRAVAARHGHPQVLHAHFLPWASALVTSRSAHRVPVVVTEHWSRLSQTLDPATRRLGEQTYPRASAVLAVSQPLARVIEREFGVACQVVGNIVDVEAFATAARAPRGPGVRLAATGNLIARKNVDGLLRAFAAGAPREATLAIIGEGPQRATLEALAADLGVGARVRFVGRLTRAELVAEYALATGFALTSHAETFGVVWAEALAAGLPVLATRCGGPEDFVTGEVGVLVEDHPDAVARGLNELCAGIEAGRWSSEALVAAVAQRYSAGAMVSRLRQVYGRVRGAEND